MESTSSSSGSEQEGGGTIEDTTIFQEVEDTFSIPFSLTPARISVTPAPNSNSLARDWDTSLYYATRNQPREETAIFPDPSCVFAPHLTVATQQEIDVSRKAVMIPETGDVPEIEVPSPSISTESGFPTHVLSDAPQAKDGSLQEEQQVSPTHVNSIGESTTAPEQVPQYPPCASIPNFTIKQTVADDCEEVIWGGMPYNQLLKTIDEFYEKMVFFRKNLFKLPSGKPGIELVGELAFWLRQFNRNGKLNKVAIKSVMILPTLLVQKPSPNKQHSCALERRLHQWRCG